MSGVAGAIPDGANSGYLGPLVREDGGCVGADTKKCCEELADQAKAAAEAQDEPEAAHQYHRLAISCPEQRRAALTGIMGLASRRDDSGAIHMRVGFQPRFDEGVRLYWASAAVGRQILPARLAQGPHLVDIEIHLLRHLDSESPTLIRLKQSIKVENSAADTIVVRIGPRLDPEPEISILRVTNFGPGTPPWLTASQARLQSMGRPRLTREMGPFETSHIVPFSLCADADARLDWAASRVPLHPRLLGAMVDALRVARWSPTTPDGQWHSGGFCAKYFFDFGQPPSGGGGDNAPTATPPAR